MKDRNDVGKQWCKWQYLNLGMFSNLQQYFSVYGTSTLMCVCVEHPLVSSFHSLLSTQSILHVCTLLCPLFEAASPFSSRGLTPLLSLPASVFVFFLILWRHSSDLIQSALTHSSVMLSHMDLAGLRLAWSWQPVSHPSIRFLFCQNYTKKDLVQKKKIMTHLQKYLFLTRWSTLVTVVHMCTWLWTYCGLCSPPDLRVNVTAFPRAFFHDHHVNKVINKTIRTKWTRLKDLKKGTRHTMI